MCIWDGKAFVHLFLLLQDGRLKDFVLCLSFPALLHLGQSAGLRVVCLACSTIEAGSYVTQLKLTIFKCVLYSSLPPRAVIDHETERASRGYSDSCTLFFSPANPSPSRRKTRRSVFRGFPYIQVRSP